jgi:hypothetical protein
MLPYRKQAFTDIACLWDPNYENILTVSPACGGLRAANYRAAADGKT